MLAYPSSSLTYVHPHYPSDSSPASTKCGSTCRLSCRVIPPALAAIASLVAIVVALFFQAPYFAIPAAMGFLGSVYAIKTAFDVNTEIEQQITSLTTENKTYAEQNRVYKYQLERSEKQLEEQNTLYQTFKSGVNELNDTTQNIKEMVTIVPELKSFVTKLKRSEATTGTMLENVGNLQKILASIDGLRNQLETINFARHLAEHAQVVQGLRENEQRLRLTANEVSRLRDIKVNLENSATLFRNEINNLTEERGVLHIEIQRLRTEIDRLVPGPRS